MSQEQVQPTIPITRRPPVGRSDLLLCLSAMPNAPIGFLARLCGLESHARTPSEERADHRAPRGRGTVEPVSVAPVPEPAPASSESPRTTFLCAMTAASHDPADAAAEDDLLLKAERLLNEGNAITPAELEEQPSKPPPPRPPLVPWARLWPFLRRSLGRLRESSRPDLRRLVRAMAAQRPITRVPRARHPAWPDRLTIVADRRRDLALFREDLDALIDQLERQHATGCVEVVNVPSNAALPDPPATGEAVLVLGDLGFLSGDRELANGWRSYLRSLERAGNPRAALVLGPRNRWDAALPAETPVAVWDRRESRPAGRDGHRPRPPLSPERRQAAVQQLLTLLAPSVRVETGLLRVARHLLGGAADVGTEYDAWHDPRAANDEVFAMGVRAVESLELEEAFRRQVSEPVKAAWLDWVRRWHRYLAETIRTDELLKFSRFGAPVPADEVAAARRVQQRAAARLLELGREGEAGRAVAIRDGYWDWHRRGYARSPVEARAIEEHLAVGWAVFRHLQGGQHVEVPEDLDSELVAQVLRVLERVPAVETLWEVRQHGAALHLRPWVAPRSRQNPTPLSIGVPLAQLRARRAHIQVTVKEVDETPTTHSFITSDARRLAFGLGNPERIRLLTDCAELDLRAITRPAWATRLAQDAFGLVAEFAVDGVSFRLRWIPPGSFQMGSPEDEKGRYEDESPRHLVTISRGFWLGETPCTQAQWKAVMGDEPSNFRGEQRPVESVTWDDCVAFCERLGERVPGLPFRLPTEAEWEYACRAGTGSAFNDGSDCTEPRGEDPALKQLGWYGKNSAGETHPVGGKEPNGWGLYDLHGNVWEWCADRAEWTGSEVVTEGYVDGAVDPMSWKGARRVVRGGSIWYFARSCRSAYRFALVPGNRDRSRGFRLAAGQELRSGASGPEAGGAAAPKPEDRDAEPGGARMARASTRQKRE
ncbi:MAG: formylglycine-generating enzyme family protein [Verrucomicrobiales bacterium]|nr:formylglycine-generating enzyme family protein [Verrucomicrobiales bacterium]